MAPTGGVAELTSIHPVLAVRDLAADAAYYVEKLGFTVSWRWGDPPVRVGVQRDGLELQLAAEGGGPPATVSVVYIQVRGIDSYHEECVARGAEIAIPLGDRPFGMRDFRIVDRSGNRLGFGEAVAKSESPL